MKHLAMDLEEALDAAAPDAGEETGRILSRRNAPKQLLVPPTARGLIRMTLEEWLQIGLLWAACLLAPIWMYPIWALLLAGRFHALGVILHDATHMPLRGKPLSLRFVEVLCGYPIASTLNAMRYHHLRHHRETGMATDPYHKPGQKNFSWWATNLSRGLVLVPFGASGVMWAL